MSKRLQVILPDEDAEVLRAVAQSEGLTVSEWVRRAIRLARRQISEEDTARKLSVVRAAARHSFPTGDIDVMLAEIERGYSAR